MKYKVIKGTFHVKGYSPDGDSIRFQANNHDIGIFLIGKRRIVKKERKNN